MKALRTSTLPDRSPREESVRPGGGFPNVLGGKSWQRSGAVTELLLFNAVQMQDAQQHISCFLCVFREDDVAISLEGPVDTADEDHRHLDVRVAVGIAHVRSLVNQDVVEDA